MVGSRSARARPGAPSPVPGLRVPLGPLGELHPRRDLLRAVLDLGVREPVCLGELAVDTLALQVERPGVASVLSRAPCTFGE